MNFKCPDCNKVVAKEDRRRRTPRLESVNGGVIITQARQATKIRCPRCSVSIALLHRPPYEPNDSDV